MKFIACATGLALASGLALGAKPGAHQHGVASLQVAVEGNTLEIGLESPLDNLLGYERGPRTEKERQAVRAMAQRFHDPASLFVPTAAAGCKPEPAQLSSEVIDPALLAAAGSASPSVPPAAGAGASGHAELEATLRYTCANPAALKGLEVKLFQAFPGLRRLDSAVITPAGQQGARLTPKQTTLAW